MKRAHEKDKKAVKLKYLLIDSLFYLLHFVIIKKEETEKYKK